MRVGLPVKIKVHAYRFQRYGMLGGTVEKISPDTAVQGDSGAPSNVQALPMYRAVISVYPVGDGAIDRQALNAGMAVSAEIDVGQRTPMEYLVDPVRGTVGEAGRE